ncbi:sigma-54 interaction domain-containing protein [Emergencia sp.]|uniref:sigma-54 interaction domain-containing protein n=1 Tax=Emergencia sp. TaxID=1926557 RepID=UPI003AF19BAF
MYEELAASVFKAQNFFDEFAIFDTDCICRYSEIINPDTYSFTADEIIGKHLFEIFPTSNEENSEIYSVLKTGCPVIQFEENGVTYKGDIVRGYSSVYPLFHKKKLIGAAVALKFIGSDYHKEYINVQDFSSNRSKGAENYTVDDIITVDPAMKKIKLKIMKVRDMDSSVLIEGSTGTGKELIAQALHYSSSRASMPFISLNCSAVPANLLESTLFGTEKGSYTGAVTRKGLFELADKGTLFLDEINSLEPPLQAKLLKAIEEKAVRHLGGHDQLQVDTRIIAAINEEPFQAIEKGHLRSDLFYRLNVIAFHLPLLKDRSGDVEFLTQYYIDYYNQKYSKSIQGLTSEAKLLFINHHWPGNVRELRNMIEGAFAIAESSLITPEDLPPYLIKQGSQPITYQEHLEAFERELLQKTLASCTTKTQAAEKLGMTKQALNYKLTSLGLK